MKKPINLKNVLFYMLVISMLVAGTVIFVEVLQQRNERTHKVDYQSPSSAYSALGKKALKMVDKYLDFEINDTTARMETDEILNNLNMISRASDRTTGDSAVASTLYEISTCLRKLAFYNQFGEHLTEETTYYDLLNIRNKLATVLGEANR